MSDILSTILAGPPIDTQAFPTNSRYSGVPLVRRTLPDGTIQVYVSRRFIPQPERFAQLHEHMVTEGERLDQIAARELGDPELSWRICDANRAMRPEDLTDTVGRRLRITLPAGVPGMNNA
ncbi:MAG TPA: hypothetical protein VIW26_02160 [Gemmatimonadales bacterium]|jgi:hypothetical protein